MAKKWKFAKKNRTWAVSIIRKHGEFLGYVETGQGGSRRHRGGQGQSI
jgi:hypothetical protein